MNAENALQMFLEYQQRLNHSEHTIEAYRIDLRQFMAFAAHETGKEVDELCLADIDVYVIRSFLGVLSDTGASRRTVARKLAAIRSFYRFLTQEKIVDANPVRKISSPKLGRRLPRFLHLNQMEKLLNEPDLTTPLGLRDQVILELLYGSGLRVSELVGLNRKDVDLNSGLIRVYGKGRKERVVPMTTQAKTVLKQYLDSRSDDDEALILNYQGTRLSARSVRRILEKLAKSAGIDQHVHPHILRHTFATHLLDGGADLRSVQELLGHQKLSSTQIYTHLTTERLRDVYLHAHPHARRKNS